MNINNGQEHFSKIIVDADKALITSSQSVQRSYVVATYNKTGESIEFDGVSKLWGLTKKPGGWLGEVNRIFGMDVGKGDWTVEEKFVLREDMTDHLEEAKRQFAFFVHGIKSMGVADDYVLCLGGEGNFRYDIANILPYKGERKEKPLLFEALKEDVFSQYKNKLHIANGIESDDVCGMYAAKNQAQFRKTGKYPYVLCYEDKDLKQLWGPWIHLGRKEQGIQWITPLEAATHFAVQLLKGDKAVDNIQGLPDLSPETREKYSLRKGTGCGDVAAEAILRGCKDIKEVFERVVDTYKLYYGEDVYEFESHRGDTLQYTWKEFLNENARLLWMLRTENNEWDIFTGLLDKIGVKYE